MPKAFTPHEKDLIRHRLLEAGYKQFSAYGLRKTNVDELAQAAGISKGAFYIFFDSKESLFMDVIEMVEERFRLEIFAAIEQPGDSPQARLAVVLKQAFNSAREMPILQFISSSDYDLLFRRMGPGKLQEHIASDQLFVEELVERCRRAGIPIQVPANALIGLLYPLILALLHEGDFTPYKMSGSFDVLLDLVAAYCLGEVQLSIAANSTFMSSQGETS
jgi:AcrR family transcriptional regulator